jgi:DNA-binding transcriptional LysR family regulator
MLIQHLRYLVALARERHFARAAESCRVAQPTLSEGIRQLEDDLGVPIVERRQRYQGLTPAGTRVLAWANRIIADAESLTQEVSELRDGLVGRLTLSAIPAMHPVVPLLTTPLIDAHPKVSVMVLSQTSVEIQRSLDDFSVDAGLTYLDNEPLERVKTQAMYREHYVLVTQLSGPFAGRTEVTWKEAATLRLCLLADAMQNRRRGAAGAGRDDVAADRVRPRRARRLGDDSSAYVCPARGIAAKRRCAAARGARRRAHDRPGRGQARSAPTGGPGAARDRA